MKTENRQAAESSFSTLREISLLIEIYLSDALNTLGLQLATSQF